MQTPLIIAIIASSLSVLSIIVQAVISKRQIKQLKDHKNTTIRIESRGGGKYEIKAGSMDPRELKQSVENLLHN